MGLVGALPWWVKLAGKLGLSRLPVPYRWWRSLGMFRHGQMNSPERAIATYRGYHDRAMRHATLAPGFHCLELGPGDSILSGLVARALGAGRSWLVDAGRFADTDVAACRRVCQLLTAEGYPAPSLEGARNLDEVLDRCGISYLVDGTKSLAAIPTATIDFCWSQVVLEHVPRDEFPVLVRELRRITAPGAIGVHSIDFRDHLDGGLNNLRFDERLWEGPSFRRSGFYTNRLRPREIIEMFGAAGFECQVLLETRWTSVPIARRHLAEPFAGMPDEDLIVAEIELLTRVA